MLKPSKTHLAVLSALAMGAALPAGATGVTLQGKVLSADAVSGATLCLDLNHNKTCDAGEPTSRTAGDGTYSLAVGAADAGKYTVIAEVPASAARGAHALEAPVGRHGLISPFSTLVQNEIDNNSGYAPEVAEGIVGRDFLLPVSALYADYTAAGVAGSEAKTKATLIAGLLAREMEESDKVLALTAGKRTAAMLYARNSAGQRSLKMMETLPSVGGDPVRAVAAINLDNKDRADLIAVLEREKLFDKVITRPVREAYIDNMLGALSYDASAKRLKFSVVAYRDGEVRRIDANKTTTPMLMAQGDLAKTPLVRVASYAALPDGSMRVMTATKSETVYTTMEVDLGGQSIRLSQLLSASSGPNVIPTELDLAVTFQPGDKMWREDHSKNPFAVDQVAFSTKAANVASLEAWVKGASDALSPYENLSSYNLYFKPANAANPLAGGEIMGNNVSANVDVKLGSYFSKTVNGNVYLVVAPTLLSRTNSAAEKVFVYDAASRTVKSASYRDYVRHCLCWQRKLSLSALKRIADALRSANSTLVGAGGGNEVMHAAVAFGEPAPMPFCGGCVLGNCAACPLAEIVGMR